MSTIIRYKNVFEGKGDQMLYLRSLKSCVFALALLVAGLISASQALAHSVEAQLEEITVKWVEAFKQRDFVTIEGFYAPDGFLLAPNSPAIQGRQAIGEMWKSWGELPNVEITFGAVVGEASSSGDMAYEYGTYIFAWDTDSGRITDKGKYVTVWKKIGGAWQVMTDIFNSNLPAE
jgi:ketosteroid isomerase-like protein